MGDQKAPFERVPAIDMADFVAWWERTGGGGGGGTDGAAEPDEGARLVASEVGRACREVGFLILTNSGIEPALMDEVMRASRQFFASPAERKASAACDGSAYGRGYEKLAGKEAFEMGREPADRDPDPPPPLYERNRWPDGAEAGAPGRSFRATAEAYYAASLRAARCLFAAMCIALEVPLSGGIFAAAADPLAQLRMWRYEGGLAEGGLPAHTDHGFLTLLLQDGCGGLQIRNAAGAWIDVPPAPSTVVVNAGRLLARWTGGEFPATVHRVLRNERDRFSVALFWAPSWRTRISGGAPGDAVGVGEYIEEGYRWQGDVNKQST